MFIQKLCHKNHYLNYAVYMKYYLVFEVGSRQNKIEPRKGNEDLRYQGIVFDTRSSIKITWLHSFWINQKYFLKHTFKIFYSLTEEDDKVTSHVSFCMLRPTDICFCCLLYLIVCYKCILYYVSYASIYKIYVDTRFMMYID